MCVCVCVCPPRLSICNIYIYTIRSSFPEILPNHMLSIYQLTLRYTASWIFFFLTFRELLPSLTCTITRGSVLRRQVSPRTELQPLGRRPLHVHRTRVQEPLFYHRNWLPLVSVINWNWGNIFLKNSYTIRCPLILKSEIPKTNHDSTQLFHNIGMILYGF